MTKRNQIQLEDCIGEFVLCQRQSRDRNRLDTIEFEHGEVLRFKKSFFEITLFKYNIDID